LKTLSLSGTAVTPHAVDELKKAIGPFKEYPF
jgi:hypothetical protein